MSFGFEHRLSDPRPRIWLARAAVAVGIAATMATLAPLSSSQSAVGGTTRCIRTSGNVAHYCGRARARLSVFPNALFKGGFCAHKKVAGIDLLQVRIGAKSLDASRTNGGLPYFSLGIADPRSRPRSGNVIAYYRSKRWVGRVVSWKGGAAGGMFGAQSIVGGHGEAGGRFRC
jgi:hypothetical protein